MFQCHYLLGICCKFSKRGSAVGKVSKKLSSWVVFFAYAQLLFSIYCMGYAKSYSSTQFAICDGDWYICEVFFPCVAFLPAVAITLPAVIYAYWESSRKSQAVTVPTNTPDDRNSIDSQQIQRGYYPPNYLSYFIIRGHETIDKYCIGICRVP